VEWARILTQKALQVYLIIFVIAICNADPLILPAARMCWMRGQTQDLIIGTQDFKEEGENQGQTCLFYEYQYSLKNSAGLGPLSVLIIQERALSIFHHLGNYN